MAFDLAKLLADRHGENFALHGERMNPQLARVLRTLGFDRFYVRGEGCYLFDDAGERYLDFLSGFGVFALGRSHPAHQGGAAPGHRSRPARTWCRWTARCCPACWPRRWWPGPRRDQPGVLLQLGAEAVESAIKFARYATERPRIVYCGPRLPRPDARAPWP